MDNKIDIRFINEQIKLENNVNDISDKISSINLKKITESMQSNIKIAKEEIEEIIKELTISTENKITNLKVKNTVLKDKNNIDKNSIDNNNIDKTSYEYRSKHLKRKLSDTGFYSILGRIHKYR